MATDLVETAKRLRKVMSDSATGPLIAASEVVKLSEQWDDPPTPPAGGSGGAAPKADLGTLRDQAGGMTCDGWLRTSGIAAGGIEYFRARQRAIEQLGEAVRRTIHHNVAVYIVRSVPAQFHDQVKLEMMRGARERNGNPLTPAQARKRIYKIIGHQAAAKGACTRCEVLEHALRDNGIPVPE